MCHEKYFMKSTEMQTLSTGHAKHLMGSKTTRHDVYYSFVIDSLCPASKKSFWDNTSFSAIIIICLHKF